MKKIFILKLFIILLISSIFLIFILHCDVKATNFEGPDLNLDKIDEGEILCYDSKTKETTVVDMEELKQVLKSQRGETVDTTTTSSYIPRGESYILKESSFAAPNRAKYSVTDVEASMQKVNNTFVFPHKQTCRVTFKKSNGETSNGTGSLIGPNILLTCAHCIYDPDNNNALYSDWTAYPGYNDHQYIQGKANHIRVYVSSRWMESHSAKYDWVICILNSDLGNHIGWLGLQSYGQNSHLSNVEVKALGYPSDVNLGFDYNARFQYETNGNVKSVYDTYFTYSGLTAGGFSGGPVLRTSDYRIAGVHQGLSKEGGDPVGVRISQAMVDLVNSLHNQ